jgi:VanZ family protein
MSLIYAGSTDLLSSRNTARFLDPLLHWIFPKLTPAGLQRVHAIVRKTGHVVEYAVLAVLVWWALGGGARRTWQPRFVAGALAIAVAYAITDEFHQSFVSTRQGSWPDVLIDAGGAGFGLGVAWLASRTFRRQSMAPS